MSIDTLLAGMAPSVTARICKFNRFNGGYTTVDAACGSSLAALEVGMQRLRDHSSNICVVGGVGVISPYFYIQCSQAGTLSQQGCFPFDPRASGFVVGEGAGFVVIKRLQDALKNGDKIHAVLRGIGSASDGTRGGLWSPNSEGQKLAVTRALRQCDHEFHQLDLIECHGTGTKVGDAEELKTLSDLARGHDYTVPVAIGSVKGSIGHLLPGAGMAGLIRTVLALKNKILPPTVGHENSIESLASANSYFYIPDTPRPFVPRSLDGVARGMVNSFGFGGVNFNAQVEAFHPAYHSQWAEFNRDSKGAKTRFPVQLSANTESANMPIAVVGMDVLLPGANGLEQFHRNLMENKSAIGAPPLGRFPDEFLRKRDQLESEKKIENAKVEAGYLDWQAPSNSVRWKIPPNDVKDVDPNQFRFFKVVEEALKQAQLLERKDILKDAALLSGVMIDSDFYSRAESSIRFFVLLNEVEKTIHDELSGSKSESEMDDFLKSVRDEMISQVRDQMYFVTQNSAVAGIDSILGSRTAKLFNMQGGSYAFDGVCASGLLQIDHALRLLRSGEKSAVVVASSTMAMNPAILDCYNKLTGGWVNGVSRPFDRDRRSFTLGEGAASLVLMRMDDAIKQGIEVIALIHSSGVSSDGTTNQMLQPTHQTFKGAVVSAYQNLGPLPPEISSIEANGLGTPLSDEAEMKTYSEMFAKGKSKPLILSGLKGAIGHLKVVSGLVNTVKACLSLQKKYIYPTTGFLKPDPLLEQGNMTVLTKALNIDATQRFVGVSSIGLGGINAHLILSNYSKEWSQQGKVEVHSLEASPVVSGSAQERGRAFGQRWKSELANGITNFSQSSLDRTNLVLSPEDRADFERHLSMDVKQELAAFAQEIGVAFSMVLDFQAMLQVWITQFGACLAFTHQDSNGNRIHAGTLDIPLLNSEEAKSARNSLIKVSAQGKLSYHGIHFWGSIFPMAGFNEAGISLSLCTGSAVKHSARSGQPFGVFARRVLESARSLNDVLDLARETTMCGSWNFLIHSSDEKKSLLLEMVGDQMEHRIGDLFQCTNHFQHIQSQNDRTDSLVRLKRLQELTSRPFQEWEESFAVLGDQFDLERGKVARWPTANTLNRYNSAVSYVFRPEVKQTFVSLNQVPSGSGPYRGYRASETTQPSSDITQQSSLMTWREVIGQPQQDLPWVSATETKFLIWKTEKDLLEIEFVQDKEIVLIDQLGFGDSDSDEVLNIFYLKVRLIKELILKGGRFLQIQLWGQDDYPVCQERTSSVSALFQMSRAFYRSLVLEKHIDDAYFVRVPQWNLLKLSRLQILKSDLKDWCCSYTEVFPVLKVARSHYLNTKPLPETNENTLGVVLITGGLGDLGFELMMMMAKKFPETQFVIMGRTKLQASTEQDKAKFFEEELKLNSKESLRELSRRWTLIEKGQRLSKKLSQLRENGIVADYYALDLCDSVATEFKITEILQKYGVINRIYHAAGIELSKLFRDKREDDFRRVVETKVRGSQNLFRALKKYAPAEQLAQVALFSSITAEIGNVGQTDYSAANAFYKAYSVHLKTEFPHSNVRNILWPAWDDVGMAVRGIKEILIERGFKFISLTDGLSYLVDASPNGTNCFEVVTPSVPDLITQGPEFLKFDLKDGRMADVSPSAQYKSIVVVNPDLLSSVWQQHFVQGGPVLPGVFWIDLMAQWSRKVFGVQNVGVKQVSFLRALKSDGQFHPLMYLHRRQNSDSTLQGTKIFGQAARLSTQGVVLNPMETFVEAEFVPLRGDAQVQRLSMKEFEFASSGTELYQNLNARFDGHLTPDFQKIKKYSVKGNERVILWVERDSDETDGYVLDAMNQGVVAFPELAQSSSFHFLPHQIDGLIWMKPFTGIHRFAITINKKRFSASHLEFAVAFYDGDSGEVLLTIEKLTHQTTNLNKLTGEHLWT
jgi:acyl transferase domain-containing protein/NAD(P)-dependent dehydrogenase (short-subunit alcohol dehydrogenase family)